MSIKPPYEMSFKNWFRGLITTYILGGFIGVLIFVAGMGYPLFTVGFRVTNLAVGVGFGVISIVCIGLWMNAVRVKEEVQS